MDRERRHAAPPASAGQHGFRLGRLAGVEVRIDWSLTIVFVLIAFNLGAGLFPARHPAWSPPVAWTVAVLAAGGFVACVLAHELAHAIVGRRAGVEVEGITLFMFGGMARMRTEPKSARAELAMTVAGPLTSLLIGAGCLALGVALAWRDLSGHLDPGLVVRRAGPLATVLLWLGPLNLALAAFNLLPGFPLDGGRVLRALIWGATGDFDKATRWATAVGRALALVLIFIGVAMIFGARVPFFGRGLLPGLWLALIGWFLNSAAIRSQQQQLLGKSLKGMSVAQLMRSARPVRPETSVADLAETFLAAADQRCFPVAEEDRLLGLVCLADLRRVPRADWEQRRVLDVMTPTEALDTVGPRDAAVDAFRKLATRDVDQLPVVSSGRLLGMIRRPDLLRWLELNTPAAASA
jgi:Zn-dependent protease/CBS domain-containing protein